MTPVQTIIDVLGFCCILYVMPMPFPIFPLVAALLFPAVAGDAAFVGMLVSLFLGTPYVLAKGFLDGSS